jgi:soluble lytic murein transglycosylase-like protein
MPAFVALLAVFSAMAEAPPPSMRDLMRAAADKQRAAAAIQLESVRKQAQSVGMAAPAAAVFPVFTVPPACEPTPEPQVAPIIEAAAKAQDVPSKLLRAVIEQESGWRACAVSPKGALGLMQLMPAAIDDLGVSNPFDPAESIGAGARFLKQLLAKYKGDLPLALGAYNAGPSAVDQAGGIPEIPETRDYVDAILRKLAR